MYLMMRKIRAMGIKMILSGEGADEIFGGYLYFHKAPDGRALHEETVRKLQKMVQFPISAFWVYIFLAAKAATLSSSSQITTVWKRPAFT